MKFTVEKQEKNIVKLNIEVEADVAAQEYNKACRKISNQVSIPGFRKGKAPRNMVEKYVGEEKIQREALSTILPSVFAEAISENNFDVVTEPNVESYDYKVGEPLVVSAVLELKPEVKLPDYKGLKVDVEKYSTADDAMDKELKALQDKFATLEPVVDRNTVESDIVIMDFDGSVEGEKIKGGSAKNHQLDLQNSNFIPGFAEQLVDKKIGEEFTIDVNFPDEYHDESLKGKPAQFKIKINEVKEKKVPEINDDLAKKVGAFETLEDLKKDMSTYLEKTEEMENSQRAQKAIIDDIIEKSEVEIPDSMINKEARVLMGELQQKMQAQGINWEQVVDQKGHESMWAELREEALKRVKNSLVLGEVAQAENIEVTEEDFDQKVQELAQMYGTETKMIYDQIAANPAMANMLTQQIMGQTIVKFLEDNNEVNFVESK